MEARFCAGRLRLLHCISNSAVLPGFTGLRTYFFILLGQQESTFLESLRSPERNGEGMYSGNVNALASRFMLSTDRNTAQPDGLPDAALEALMDRAREAASRSYSPYSGFRVGAALKLTNGEIVTGTNVENISYGLTICAERSARARAVTDFGPGIRVAAVAVANLNGAASPPCGACRQVLAEFILPEAPVIFPTADGVRVMPFSAVLPLAFEMKLK